MLGADVEDGRAGFGGAVVNLAAVLRERGAVRGANTAGRERDPGTRLLVLEVDIGEVGRIDLGGIEDLDERDLVATGASGVRAVERAARIEEIADDDAESAAADRGRHRVHGGREIGLASGSKRVEKGVHSGRFRADPLLAADDAGGREVVAEATAARSSPLIAIAADAGGDPRRLPELRRSAELHRAAEVSTSEREAKRRLVGDEANSSHFRGARTRPRRCDVIVADTARAGRRRDRRRRRCDASSSLAATARPAESRAER